jgi:hypothetical protein
VQYDVLLSSVSTLGQQDAEWLQMNHDARGYQGQIDYSSTVVSKLQ